jgi:hypothetical protein
MALDFTGVATTLSEQEPTVMNSVKSLACTCVAFSAFAAACVVNSVASACDPPVKAAAGIRIIVPKPCSDITILEQLELLKRPVRVRVLQCENELEQAELALASACSDRDGAQAAADLALARVETAACLLKKMCRRIEINCRTYTEDEVAEAVQILICRYREAAATLTAAESRVAESTQQLAVVQQKVARWQQKEKALLEQVAGLRNAHESARSRGERAKAAAALANELSGMLGHKPAAADQPDVTVEITPDPASVEADATEQKHDQLFDEVDKILNAGK